MKKNISTTETNRISQNISLLTDDLNTSINWANQWLSSSIQGSCLKNLKKIRRELKKINYAIKQNTAAALFGESQVGKSYLIKTLLSNDNSRLKITNFATNKKIDWLRYINPDGKGMESTGIVTRFSTRVDLPDNKFPIEATLVSPKDIVLILLDSFFNDIQEYSISVDISDIDNYIRELNQLLETSPGHEQENFTEDDVLDIKDYFISHFHSQLPILNQSTYWDFVSVNIHNVESKNWVKVFGIIWGRNKFISDIFNKMVKQLKELNFAKTVYLEFQSILKKHGTLLHVNRLKDINSGPRYLDLDKKDEYNSKVNILYLFKGKRIEDEVEKSLLCSIIEELKIKIDKELEKHKPIIKLTDLLDFPGAKPRLLKDENDLSENDIGEMLLRGKVAYAFNKYSESQLITNLLFCHHDSDVNVKYLPSLLNTWIENHIGRNREERELILSKTSTPPLFIIFTFFNNQLEYDPILDKDTDSGLTKRWKGKFKNIFEDQLVKNNWHIEWRTNQIYFQNFFLLRDFEKSTNIFNGFNADTRRPEKSISAKNQEHLKRLKASFIDSDFVKRHFQKPGNSWDESACIKKDGSDLIIKRLSNVSDNQTRIRMFVTKLDRLASSLKQELTHHYFSKEKSNQINLAYQKACNIQREADTYFFHDKRNPFLFGQFLQQFLVKEKEVYNLFSDAISDPKTLLEQGLTNYTAILLRCPEISKDKKFEENLEILKTRYNFHSSQEAKNYFENKDVDLFHLFSSEEKEQKRTSIMLAEILRDDWFSKHLDINRFDDFTKSVINFSQQELEQLIENIKLSFNNKVKLHEIIAKEISELVDRDENKYNTLPMIADIGARLINKFINTMGIAFYTPDQINKVKAISKSNPELFSIDFDFENEVSRSLTNEELVKLFDDINKYEELANNTAINREILKKFPVLKKLQTWSEFIKISFIGNCEVSNFNIIANNDLEKIINKVEKHSFHLNQEKVFSLIDSKTP